MTTGCAMFSKDANQPRDIYRLFPWLLGDRQANVISGTASHRFVLLTVNDGRTVMCAEPSPDVGEEITSSLNNQLELAVKHAQSDIGVQLADSYNRTLNTKLMSLLNRTQSLQFYRNSINALCLDRLNSGWTPKVETPSDQSGASKPVYTYSTDGQSNSGQTKNSSGDQSNNVPYELTTNYENFRRYIFDKTAHLLHSEIKYKTLDAAVTALQSSLEAVSASSSNRKQAEQALATKQAEVNKSESALALAIKMAKNSKPSDKFKALEKVREATLTLEAAKADANVASGELKKAVSTLNSANENVSKAQEVVTKITNSL